LRISFQLTPSMVETSSEESKESMQTETSEAVVNSEKSCEKDSADSQLPTDTDMIGEESGEHPQSNKNIVPAENLDFIAPSMPIKFNKPSATKEENEKNEIKGSKNKEKKVSKQVEKPKLDIPYREPLWSGVPDAEYSVEVIKDGIPKGSHALTGKPYFVFGRMEDCDVVVEHPSCSRYHAVFQYCAEEAPTCKKGFYVYDVGSSHGTYLNKKKISSRVFCRLRVGYVVKFGCSSRLYIVQGPPEDQEEEIDMEEVRRKQQEEREALAKEIAAKKQAAIDASEQERSNKPSSPEEVTWGFSEDAVDEQLNLQELLNKKKNIDVKDPKKGVKTFFESEGLDFEYEMEEKMLGRTLIHFAKLRLPIETSTSDEVIAEGKASNKKDAVLACATEACRLIHAYDDILKKSREDQNVKRKRELEARDFYDSDDDTFLDRTGAVERKRLQRMKQAGKKPEKEEALSHDALKEKLLGLETEIFALNEKLRLSEDAERDMKKGDGDSLDNFMSSIGGVLEKKEKNQIKQQIIQLKKEAASVNKLVEKTKPALPTINPTLKRKSSDHIAKLKKAANLPSVNKLKQPSSQISKSGPTPKSRNESLKNNTEDESEKTVKNTVPTQELNTNTEPMVTKDEEENKTSEDEIVKVTEKDHPPQKKKTRVLGPAIPKAALDSLTNTSKETSNDPKVSTWMPPENQSGDGKTHLNAKFGY